MENNEGTALSEPFGRRGWTALLLGMTLSLLWLEVFSVERLVENIPGLGVAAFTLSTIAAEAMCLGRGMRLTGDSLLLAAGAAALSVGCITTGLGILRLMSTALIAAVLPMAAFSLSGSAKRSWRELGSLWETVKLFFPALFRFWPAPFKALARRGGGNGSMRVLGVVIGVCAAAPVLLLVLLLLSSADQVFSGFLHGIDDWIFEADIGELLWYAVRWGIFALMFFSLLSTLLGQREETDGGAATRKKRDDVERPSVAASSGLTAVLLLMDVVYLAFGAVQVVYLFGGAESVAMSGGYAQYARSGFMELVAVAAINLCLMLIAGRASAAPGGGIIRGLAMSLAALTLLVLASAVMRMCLYIGEYGLSVLRLMTLWAMAFILACIVAAAIRCCRREFKFWPVFFAAAIWGWSAFTLVSPERIVANYNVDAYLDGRIGQIDIEYLLELAPGSKAALEKLERAEPELRAWYQGQERSLNDCLELLPERGRWVYWSI